MIASTQEERNYGLGMDALLVSSTQEERNYGLGMDALVVAFTRRRTGLWFGHGCSGDRIQSKTNVIMVWAWMLW